MFGEGWVTKTYIRYFTTSNGSVIENDKEYWINYKLIALLCRMRILKGQGSGQDKSTLTLGYKV